MRLTQRTGVFYAALLLLAAPLAAENRALLFGVGDYQGQIPKLPGIDKDMALAREFALLMGFRPNQIKELFNQQATLANVKLAFNTWLKEAKPNDKVFIFFSGHGSQVPDTNGDEEDGQDELLVTYDTAVVNHKLVNYLLDDEIDELVGSLDSKHILLAFDSCHSGTAARSVGYVEKRAPFPGEPRKSAQSRRVEVPRWVLLSAARDTETAGASNEGSFLTTNMVKVAKEYKQAGRPFILRSARADIEKGVLRSKPDQHPGLDGSQTLEDEDWFRIGNNDAPGPSQPGPPSPGPAPAPAPGPSVGLTGELADKLEQIYNQRVGDLKCGISGGATLQSESKVQITCDLPRPGFLYVFNLGAGDTEISVLLPNKWVPSPQVEAGPITLPSAQRNFRVSVKLPPGMAQQAVRFYALLTADEIKSVPQSFTAGFGALNPVGERALKAEGPEGYEAARIELLIVK